VNIWQTYCKNQKGALFMVHSVQSSLTVSTNVWYWVILVACCSHTDIVWNSPIARASIIKNVMLCILLLIANEIVPKIVINYAEIIINNAIIFFLITAISSLLIPNHNSFWVLFDKIASVYFIWKYIKYKKIYFSIRNGQPRGPVLCQLHFRSLLLLEDGAEAGLMASATE